MKHLPHLAVVARTFFVVLVLVFPFANAATGQSVDRDKGQPNVVWVMSEDNSKHYLELFDPAGAPTPNIAAMASKGVLFERAFSNAPVCSVARTTLITSVYAPRLGTQFHRRIKPAKMPDGWEMFPTLLRRAGYYTTNNSKKDYNAIESPQVWDESSRKAHWKNRREGQPFFHVQTYTDSHESSLHFDQSWADSPDNRTDPASVTLAPYHPDTPLFRLTYARYHDRIATIDAKVGKIIEELRNAGELENTFVFYFGDHGGVLPRGKGYAYESGLHVPLVVRVPEKWKSLSPFPRGTRTRGFVEFVDFGPTVLNLAGVKVPNHVDGSPFLGASVDRSTVEREQSSFGYADRMDEKYDHCRTVRVGEWKYIRNYQAIYPDGLQNNYRYEMLAYQEWRNLYQQSKLNDVQAAFFQRKPAEQLFDLNADPYEINNLANSPQHRSKLLELRQKLASRIDSLHDLSFYPECMLVDDGILQQPVATGVQNQADLARYRQIADLALDFAPESMAKLQAAAQSTDPVDRYWAFTTASAIGAPAKDLLELARVAMDSDPELMVRLRAAELAGLLKAADPMPTLRNILEESDSSTLNLMVLQTVVLFRDSAAGFDTALEASQIKAIDSQTLRRVGYLDGLTATETKQMVKKRMREDAQKQKRRPRQ